MRRLVATLSGLALVLSGAGAEARSLQNYDALQDAKPVGRAAVGFKPVNALGARVSHRDSLTDSPTFVWARKGGAQEQLRAGFASMAPEQAALAQLKDHAALYGLSSFESAGARVVGVSQNGQGVKVVKVAQEAAGIEVFRQSLNLLLDRNNELVAISGSLSRHVSSADASARVRFQLSASQAIAAAYQDLTGTALDAGLLQRTGAKQDAGRYMHFELASYARPLTDGLLIPARVKQVLYSLPGSLVPAYYVELNTGRQDSKDSDYYAYVVSAADGSLLMRNNLTANEAFSYRVFADSTPPFTPWDGPGGTGATPHPTGTPNGYRPPFEPPALVTLESAPFSQGDPWLPDGATVTTGNNVDAYADIAAPDAYNAGDLRPTVSAPGIFDRTMRFDIAPNASADQTAAATTSLFFMNNWLHDWFYDAGFDELSGNAQADNFGRGGLGGDVLHAQAQDYSGLDNANMNTPADGASPRMQMYLFTGARNARLTALAPASVAGDYAVGVASGFGPQIFDTTGQVVVALDANNTTGPSTTDACTALTNAAQVAGQIAFADRGGCNFNVKALNAQAAGAIGLIIADNAPGFVTDIGGTSATPVNIPSVRLTLAYGNTLRAAIPSGLTTRMFRGPTMPIDGTVDNQIVAHEWGHYISNRLIGNASGLINNQGRAMGEGWGDFTALLMTVRAEDIVAPSNTNWSGAYAMADYATRGISPDSTFFGIRRVAYSVDDARNALRFRHIMDGVALPNTAPFAPNGGVNSQVHNSGEVWASMLWDCYVSLLRAYPFQEAQHRMKNYLVNGYKMTPVAPTYTEARDALIAAAAAFDPADGERFWQAFARRGMGVNAVAPERYSTNHAGTVESYDLGVRVELLAAAFADDVRPGSCDRDGVLDNGETGRLIVTVRNAGASVARNTSVTVTSPTGGISVGNGGTVRFPEIPIGGTAEVSVPVSLNGAPPLLMAALDYAIRDDLQSDTGDKTGSLLIRTNYDDAPGTSATETVEGNPNNLPWLTDYDGTLGQGYFQLVEFTDLNHAFFGPNLAAAGDIRLITPPLQVSASQPFSVTFQHAYSFEADASGYYDGAVIELSRDGGQTWVDVGASAYNGTLIVYGGNLNPLQGRAAFVGSTQGFPSFTTTTLNLGTAYAGQTVQLRFRIGSDNFAAATGWVIDNLAFSGITNTPFTGLVADDGVCVNSAPTVNAGADLSVDERTLVVLSGSASDADGDSLVYSWQQLTGPAVAMIGANTPNPSFMAPEVMFDMELVFRLSASDGTVSSEDTVTVHVRQVNHAPTVNAGLDGFTDERGVYSLSGSASDEDGDMLVYTWTQVSGTPVALFSNNHPSVAFITPEVAFDETLTFRLTVSDGQVSVSDTVDVVIRNVNRAPFVSVVPVRAQERSNVTLVADAFDPDGDALTYAWEQLSGPPVVLSGANTSQVSFFIGELSANTLFSFRVTVSDGQTFAGAELLLDVSNINTAPTVNAGLDGTVDERQTYTLTGSASDADGDALTYQWMQMSGPPVSLSGANSAQAMFLAPETVSGVTLTFILTVSDGQSSVSDSVNVTVNPANRAPVAHAGPAGSVDERASYTLTGSASDADGDALTYQWTQLSGAPVALTGANTLQPSFIAPETVMGETLVFLLTVSDGQATGSATVTVTVNPVNRAPMVTATAVLVNGSTMSLEATASDLDGDVLAYTWTQRSGAPVVLTGVNSARASFSTADVASDTVLTFRVSVSDGQTAITHDLTVSVQHLNRAPTVDAGVDGSVNERAAYTLRGSATDAEGDSLSYHWTQVSGTPVGLSGANLAQATFTAPETVSGETLTFMLTVSDGKLVSSDTVSVTVLPVNRAPVANAGVDGRVDERAAFTLGGSASDADGDSLTYSWAQVSGTPVVLSALDLAQPSFTAPETAAGATLTFRLTVSDGQSTGSDTVNVVVSPVNRAPVVSGGTVMTVDERSTASLGVTASDVDGDSLTYAWTQLTGTPVTLAGASTANASFATGEVSADSVLTFRVSVSDGQATATHDVVVNVRDVNRVPSVNAGVDGSVNERAAYTLSGSATDADGDTLSYHWVQVSGTPAGLSGADSAQATFTAPETVSGETLTFRLTVSDGQSSVSDTVNVTVTPVNRAPAVNAGVDGAVNERAGYTLSGSATDADGDTLSYLWTQVSGTQVVLSGATTAQPSFTAPETLAAGETLTFRLTVSDGAQTASDTVDVVIHNLNRAPFVSGQFFMTVEERSTASLSISATDVDGDRLTYSWTQLPVPQVTITGADTANASFHTGEVSDDVILHFQVTVDDGHTAVSRDVMVNVLNVNRAPVVNAGVDGAVDERADYTLNGSASDEDGETLSYRWVQVAGTPVALSGVESAQASFTAPETVSGGTLTFRLTVSDGRTSTSDTVNVALRAVNRAPVAHAGLPGTVDERASFTLGGTASDEDGDSLTYLWEQLSGTPVALSDVSSPRPSFTAPETASTETLTFRLTVSDGQASATATVSVVVRSVNRAPMVTSASVLEEGSTTSLEATASDADGDALGYLWTQVSGTPVTLEAANTARASFSTARVIADEVLTFRVAVSDGQATTTHDVVVRVHHINRAPAVNAGLDGLVDERAGYTLSGSATDEEGDSLSYHWTQVSGTPVALSGASSAQATFTAPETVSGDTLTFVLTVSDGKLVSSDTVSVTVRAVNRAPAVTASAVVVDERSTASLVAMASDADGDTLTYTWTQVSGTAVTLSGANTATATFAAAEVSAEDELVFRVTVSDGTTSTRQDVLVTVRQVNRAPVANAGAALTARARASVTLDGGASTDADGNVLSYQWTQVGGPWVTLTGANTATPSFTAPDVKAATELAFRLVVSDGALSSEPSIVTVTVSSDNRAPVAKAAITLNGGQTSMTLDGSASSDVDGDALTYQWEQTGGPSVQLGDARRAVLTVDVPELDGDSATFSFRLTVTDAQGASHSVTVEASATPDNGGGCSSTGAGAPAGMLGLALLALVQRRRRQS